MNFDKLYVKLGNLIMYFQRIESDLKIIYSWINSANNFSLNMKKLRGITLGKVVKMIKEFQETSNMFILTPDDFRILNSLTKKRNYWVHESFEFIYLPEDEITKEYNKIFKLATKDLNEFSHLAFVIQNFRLKIVNTTVM